MNDRSWPFCDVFQAIHAPATSTGVPQVTVCGTSSGPWGGCRVSGLGSTINAWRPLATFSGLFHLERSGVSAFMVAPLRLPRYDAHVFGSEGTLSVAADLPVERQDFFAAKTRLRRVSAPAGGHGGAEARVTYPILPVGRVAWEGMSRADLHLFEQSFVLPARYPAFRAWGAFIFQ
jgi:hypothetical protein